MYIPRANEQHDPNALREQLTARSFGALVVCGDAGVDVHHLPFVLHDAPAPLGMIHAHVARSNPVWHQLAAGREAVLIVQGPEHYISPSWYPSKAESGGKVVPTWNYVAVHAHVTATAVEDRAWLARHLTDLVDAHEAGRTPRWRISDGPADFMERMAGAIVGIEMPVRRLEGKWKLSQNRSPADRQGVVAALEADGTPPALAMAAAMRRALGE